MILELTIRLIRIDLKTRSTSCEMSVNPKEIARGLVLNSTLSLDEIDDLVLFINGDLNLAKTIAELKKKPQLLTESFLRKALNNKKQGKTIIICSSFIVSPCLLSFPVV